MRRSSVLAVCLLMASVVGCSQPPPPLAAISHASGGNAALADLHRQKPRREPQDQSADKLKLTARSTWGEVCRRASNASLRNLVSSYRHSLSMQSLSKNQEISEQKARFPGGDPTIDNGMYTEKEDWALAVDVYINSTLSQAKSQAAILGGRLDRVSSSCDTPFPELKVGVTSQAACTHSLNELDNATEGLTGASADLDRDIVAEQAARAATLVHFPGNDAPGNIGQYRANIAEYDRIQNQLDDKIDLAIAEAGTVADRLTTAMVQCHI